MADDEPDERRQRDDHDDGEPREEGCATRRLKASRDRSESIVPLRDTEQRVTRGDVRATAKAIGTTPEAFSVFLQEQSDAAGRLIRSVGIKPE